MPTQEDHKKSPLRSLRSPEQGHTKQDACKKGRVVSQHCQAPHICKGHTAVFQHAPLGTINAKHGTRKVSSSCQAISQYSLLREPRRKEEIAALSVALHICGSKLFSQVRVKHLHCHWEIVVHWENVCLVLKTQQRWGCALVHNRRTSANFPALTPLPLGMWA